ncbi:MAG: MBL fold metallo-hydrolase [Candidatus Dormiibacterota bacterium]
MSAAVAAGELRVRLVGGPTAILELGGLRLLTDPTFDEPRRFDRGTGVVLEKTSGPAVPAGHVGPIDAVLLSHDHHADNLDDGGRAFLTRVPRTLTTVPGAARLGGSAIPLAPWDHVDVPRPDGGKLRVTAMPALHGPPGSEREPGEVIGFLLAGHGLPSVYVSGDNASLEVVEEIARRIGSVEVAILFAGAAKTARLGDLPLTLTAQRAAAAAQALGAAVVVPVHFEGWTHFTEGADALRDAFVEAGIEDRLRLLTPGERVTA